MISTFEFLLIIFLLAYPGRLLLVNIGVALLHQDLVFVLNPTPGYAWLRPLKRFDQGWVLLEWLQRTADLYISDLAP